MRAITAMIEKHPLKEILAFFAQHANHTHEAATQATYDLGFEKGKQYATEQFEAGLKEAAPAPAQPVAQVSEGSADENKDEAPAEAENEDQKAP